MTSILLNRPVKPTHRTKPEILPAMRPPSEPNTAASLQRKAAGNESATNQPLTSTPRQMMPSTWGMIGHVRQGEEQRMPDETRRESADLRGLPGPRTRRTRLQGNPGDDPLDRGVATPRPAVVGRGQVRVDGRRAGIPASPSMSCSPRRSPTLPSTPTMSCPEDSDDDDEADEYLNGLLLDDGQDPRAGQLVAEGRGVRSRRRGRSRRPRRRHRRRGRQRQEAAVHVVEDDDDTDIRG